MSQIKRALHRICCSIMKHNNINLFIFIWGQWTKIKKKKGNRRKKEEGRGKREKWTNQGTEKERPFEGKEENKNKLKTWVRKYWTYVWEKRRMYWKKLKEWEMWMLRHKKSQNGISDPQEGHFVSTEECQPRAGFQERVMWLNNTPRFHLTGGWPSACWAFPKMWSIVVTSGFFNTPDY